MTKKTIALLVFGTGLFVLYLLNIPLDKTADLLHAVPKRPLLVIIAVNALTPLLKAVRWRFLLRSRGARIRFRTLFSSVSAGFFLGLVTPGTSGEFGRVITLDVNRVTGLATVLFEKVWDLVILLLLSLTALVALKLRGPALVFGVLGVWAFGAAVVFAVARRPRVASAIPRSIVRRVLSQERGDQVAAVWKAFVELLQNGRLTILTAFFSLVLWGIGGSQYFAVLRALGVPATVPMVLVSFFVPYLAGVVSLVPLGLGVFDLSTAHLSSGTFGVPKEAATAAVLLYRILVTLVLVLWGFACYLHRIRRRASAAAAEAAKASVAADA
jgi:uncharacterized protein (TIRG00374 family)